MQTDATQNENPPPSQGMGRVSVLTRGGVSRVVGTASACQLSGASTLGRVGDVPRISE